MEQSASYNAYMISIHALLAESDVNEDRYGQQYWRFLSTLSLRRATTDGLFFLGRRKNFYPRSPCGERLRGWTLNINGPIFLSTLSLRRATKLTACQNGQLLDFYPRSPCGERLWPGLLARPFFIISIHALLAESDLSQSSAKSTPEISIHALLAESDAVGVILVILII